MVYSSGHGLIYKFYLKEVEQNESEIVEWPDEIQSCEDEVVLCSLSEARLVKYLLRKTNAIFSLPYTYTTFNPKISFWHKSKKAHKKTKEHGTK